MSKKQLQEEKEAGRGQSSQVAPGDTESHGGHVKSSVPLEGVLSCQLWDGVSRCPVPSCAPEAKHCPQPAPKTVLHPYSWWEENPVCPSPQSQSGHQNTLSGIWKEKNVKGAFIAPDQIIR